MKRIVILISGGGSNMDAIIRAARAEKWPAEIVAVISNRPQAPGLELAAAHKVPAISIDHRSFSSRADFDSELQHRVDQYRPDIVVLAGFMRILSDAFVEHYAGRMVNIHPSLLPSFPGLFTHRRALQAGVKLHGATVHFVTAELDHGPIIAQAAVPVLDHDTEASLAARVLVEEHKIYPRALRALVEDKLSMVDGRVLQAQQDGA
jgi:phosphoribosylglycinamide formyltransferase 1